MDPRDRLIVALDAPDVGEAERLIAAIGDSARFYKIGMELAFGGGLALAPKLAATGKRVFVDLKLHDIPNTVERATSQIARLGAAFLTVHAYPQTMRAAVAGAQGTGLKLLAVSVLTSRAA
jgi:orotidine-5'-phosphate decarboxylase